MTIVGCTKFTALKPPTSTSNKTKVEFSSINSNITTSISVRDQWHITSNNLDTIISNDSAKAFVLLDSSNLHLQYFQLSSNKNYIPITFYDTTFNIASKSVYSIVTVSKPIAANSFANKPLVLQETDFNPPAIGYAKLRFIVAAPTVGPNENNKTPEQMIPRVVMNNNNYQIDLTAQGRFYLDNITNPTLLQFTTIPAGTYKQTPVIASIPGLTCTFESGKKYTILVTRMARTQYPENDNLKLIEHNF